jgi:copper chaperone CopZ
MKTKLITFVLLMLLLACSSAFANFISAKIKVTGVTCSMCSNSVHKALSALPFVAKIDVDLENAVFIVTFKPNEKVNIDAIRKKVEGAGFSVGLLIADFKFKDLHVTKDLHYTFGNEIYHFVNVKEQRLNGIVPVRFVDKGFTSESEYKKYVSLTGYTCIKTGNTEGKSDSGIKKRIYHVTI